MRSSIIPRVSGIVDRFGSLRRTTEERVLSGPGTTSTALRQAVAGATPPPELTRLVEKIRTRAYTVTDQDLDALRSSYSEDQIFEIVVAAVIGTARDQLRAAHHAMKLAADSDHV
jgi:hypothetical protein